MGKKGSWFSAIKRVFSPNSKKKPPNKGTLKHKESRSFIPLFREPSSIEKILREADQQKLFISAPTSPRAPSRALTPRVVSPRHAPRAVSPRVASPKAASQRLTSPVTTAARIASEKPVRDEATTRNIHVSATTIQTAYRGYTARKNLRALKALVRLQGVVRGQHVKRQTLNAMKQMQILVRIQTQIQLHRIQNLESQAQQRQFYKNDNKSEAGNNEDWDDSLLTKEEVEEKLRKRTEANLRRERALAYSYSNQKVNKKSTQKASDLNSNGFPWWRNWLEYGTNPSEIETSASKNGQLTPQKPKSDHKSSPRKQTSSHGNPSYTFENHESSTPKSSKSNIPVRFKKPQTSTTTPSRTPPPSRFSPLKYNKPRTTSPFGINDTDSLTSCPASLMPNYMVPTASAMAKARPQSNPKERSINGGTPRNDSKRRFSFPLTPNIGSFRWSKGSEKDSEISSQKVVGKHQSTRSIGEVSIDSAVSMPTMMERKPFKRFV